MIRVVVVAVAVAVVVVVVTWKMLMSRCDKLYSEVSNYSIYWKTWAGCDMRGLITMLHVTAERSHSTRERIKSQVLKVLFVTRSQKKGMNRKFFYWICWIQMCWGDIEGWLLLYAKKAFGTSTKKELGRTREGLKAGRYEICDRNILLWRHLASKLKINNLCWAYVGRLQHLFGRVSARIQLSAKT